MLKVLELFAGIGACSKALERLGIEYEIVDAVEIDKYAIESFNAIHNTNFEVQDITKWNKDINVDLIMHGSPCQDISLAGLQAGADKGSGTRSSLMYETLRIVNKLKPKYVIWENVKNLISKKHKHNFDNYVNIMLEGGYNSYYQVLNAKDYGIPQNRERVFTVSIRKDIDKGFDFPNKESLQLRLKDMLEQAVDEKYYLNNAQVERIKATTYVSGGKQRIQKEVCGTLCARDFKDPKCVRVGGIFDTEKGRHQAGSIYDKEGIAPTLDIMQGGYRQPSIIEDTIKIKNATKQVYLEAQEGDGIDISSRMQYHRGTVQKESSQTLDTQCHIGVVVGESKSAYLRNYGSKGKIQDSENVADTLQAAMGEGGGNVPLVENGIKKIEVAQIVKVRKYPVETELLKTTLRNAKLNVDLNNKEIAEQLQIPQTQVEHYFRNDNSFAIPNPEIWIKLKQILKIETDYFDKSIMTFIEKEGVYEKANRFYLDNGVSPALNTSDDIKVIGNYSPSNHDVSRVVDSEGISPTVKENHGTVTATNQNLRIRKLTPKECWRLMGFNDEDFYNAQKRLNDTFYKGKDRSTSQLYKQAGNSIVVNVLEKILNNLLKGEING